MFAYICRYNQVKILLILQEWFHASKHHGNLLFHVRPKGYIPKFSHIATYICM